MTVPAEQTSRPETGGRVTPLHPTCVAQEEAVLGSILLNREAIIAVAGWLIEDDFYLASHQQIYSAALACHAGGTPPDIRTISEELRRRQQLESCGGIMYLSRLVDAVPTSYHIEHYAQDVADTAWRRRAINELGRAVRACYNERTPIAEVITEVDAIVAGLRRSVPRSRLRERARNIKELWSMEFPPPTWIVEHILPEGTTILAGRPKQGKSWLILQIALAVATGTVALGGSQVAAGDVLYLGLEDSEQRLQMRSEMVLAGRPECSFWWETKWASADEGGIDNIEAWLVAHPNARLVVIDTLERLRCAPRRGESTYSYDYRSVARLSELAAKYKVGIVVLHHTRKADAADALESVSGSNGLTGGVDSILILQRNRLATAGKLVVIPRDGEEQRLALEFEKDRCQWRLVGNAEAVEESVERRAVLEALEQEPGGLYPRELAEILEKSSGAVRKLLWSMKKDRQVQAGDDGRYRLGNASNVRDASNAANESNVEQSRLPSLE
jgi:hypothetical protein